MHHARNQTETKVRVNRANRVQGIRRVKKGWTCTFRRLHIKISTT